MSHQQAGTVVYGPLQVRSRLRPDERVVTVHFSVKGLPEQHFVLTPDAARELAIQLMRHAKRIRRTNTTGSVEAGSPLSDLGAQGARV
jgi:hypothetical protein